MTKWAEIRSPYQQMSKELASTSTKPAPRQAQGYRKKSAEDDFSLGSSSEEPPTLGSRAVAPQYAPSTPRHARRPHARFQATLDDDSPFISNPQMTPRPTRSGWDNNLIQNQDPLLHRVLDKNYRIQATPGKKPPSKYQSTTPRRTGTGGRGLFSSNKPRTAGANYGPGGLTFDDDDDDELEAPPELQTQIFDSPIRRPSRTTTAAKDPSTFTSTTTASSRRFQQASANPRTPSRHHHSSRPKPPVLHPVSVKKMGFAATESGEGFEDDDDEFLLSPEFSPPVTIQFSLPERQILATPARIASKQLVRDILRTAGADESGSTDQSKLGGVEEDEAEYELDLGPYGSGSGDAMKGWRRTGREAGGGGGGGSGIRSGGRGLFGEEASPTIVRGRGMDVGDETF